jgi:hypothetical protein
MAATGTGLSAFHEPPPADSIFDPWWLASLLVLGLLSWRVQVAFARRSSELAYWVWAVVSFAPICGVIPLPYPMADRYLYFILPGLIGGMLFMLRDLSPRLSQSLSQHPAEVEKKIGRGALVCTGALVLVFATAAYGRSSVWKTPFSVMGDAELHYPDGIAAKTRQARRAALAGDTDTAVKILRSAYARGYNRLDHLLQDQAYAALQGDSGFKSLLNEIAIEWRDRLSRSEPHSQIELRALAQAHIVLDDYEAAREALEQAEAIQGPLDDDIASDLADVERALRFQALRRARKAAP